MTCPKCFPNKCQRGQGVCPGLSLRPGSMYSGKGTVKLTPIRFPSLQFFFYSRHDVLRTGQGDGVTQGLLTGAGGDGPPVVAVGRPAVGQAHGPLPLRGGQPGNDALRLPALPPQGKHRQPSGKQGGKRVCWFSKAPQEVPDVPRLGRPPHTVALKGVDDW